MRWTMQVVAELLEQLSGATQSLDAWRQRFASVFPDGARATAMSETRPRHRFTPRRRTDPPVRSWVSLARCLAFAQGATGALAFAQHRAPVDLASGDDELTRPGRLSLRSNAAAARQCATVGPRFRAVQSGPPAVRARAFPAKTPISQARRAASNPGSGMGVAASADSSAPVARSHLLAGCGQPAPDAVRERTEPYRQSPWRSLGRWRRVRRASEARPIAGLRGRALRPETRRTRFPDAA